MKSEWLNRTTEITEEGDHPRSTHPYSRSSCLLSSWMRCSCPRCCCLRSSICLCVNHAVVTQTFWVLNEQLQACVRVLRLGQNRGPQTWALNRGPGDYVNRVIDLHLHSGVAQMGVLQGLMSWPNIMRTMMDVIQESHEDHTKRLTENVEMLQSDQSSS